MGKRDNHWLSYKNAAATWLVRFPAHAPASALLHWLQGTVTLLEEVPLARFDAIRNIGYLRERDGALWPRLQAMAEQTGVIELFSFESVQAYGSVAWFEDGKESVRGLVDDLGKLLERLRPEDIEAASAGHMSYQPPLSLWGRKVVLAEPRRYLIEVRVELNSDIWLPWVPGYLDDEFDANSWIDNRTLARVHTPDLNVFLRRLGELTTESGGAFALDEESYPVFRWQLDDSGVLLDIPRGPR
jgi:hypothetical protein